MFTLAVVLFALSRFGSIEIAGWLSFAAVAPGLLISPIAGAILDRVGPVRAIAVDMAASATLVAAMVFADWLDRASVPDLFLLITLFSLCSPLSAAGVRTLLPRLVPVHARDRANALDTAIHGLVDVTGPALAGVLAGFAGPAPALFVIGLIYAGAAASVCALGRLRVMRSKSSRFLWQALEGIMLVARNPTLRGLAMAYSLYEMAWGILVVAVPVFAAGDLGAAKADVAAGLLWSCVGAAGGFSTLFAGRLRTANRERAVIAIGMLVTGMAAWPIGSEFGLAGLSAGLLLLGASAGPIDVGVLTLRQSRTDPAQLGRVLSISMSLNRAGFPVGAAVAGIVLPWSVSSAFVLAAVASAAGAAAALRWIPRCINGPVA